MRLQTLTETNMILILVIFTCIHQACCVDTEVVVLRAERGQDARLPCGQGKVFLDGPDAYVLWLKNDREFLYRFPNEETERRSLTLDQVFGTTCVAGACHDDTSLLLKRVSDKDSGVYRCRVHYQASPAVDYVIEIRLVDSPGTPRIYNDAGEPLKRGHIQHLSLGGNLTLTCEVDDGQPDTLVFWRRNGAIVERAQPAHARAHALRATVRVRGATRAERDAHYECLAQNADVTEPRAASVLVAMYLPPLSVEIRLNHNLDFEAGQPRVVDCVVVGCVPPPAVTWHLGDALLRPSVHKELHDGNYTVSSLTLAPSLRDSGRQLVCRAHNSHLPAAVFEDKVTLNVGYRPVCLSSGEETVGAVAREVETVTCVVDAAPEPLQFSWTFADSRTLYTSVKKVPGHQHRYSSALTWLPRGSDAGPLLCRATNAFGEQRRPCAFSVAAGGAPAVPRCAVRAEAEGLRVQCTKGWDGGRPQTVHLTVRAADGTVLHNATDPAGHFHLRPSAAGRNLSATVYASNARGRSPENTLELYDATPLSAPVTEVPPSRAWARWLEAAAGVVALAAVVAGAAVCARRARRPDPDLVPRSDGSFHREPDFTGGERVLGTTNITVNQLASCQNQYSSSPVPSCRVLVGCPRPAEPCPSHSYFV